MEASDIIKNVRLTLFQVEEYPTLLYWDKGFPGGVPRQYYKSYGLTTAGLVQWLQKQIVCTNGVKEEMCANSLGEGSSSRDSARPEQENTVTE